MFVPCRSTWDTTASLGNLMPGFGHAGWAVQSDGPTRGWMAFSFVHNRLLTPFVATDHAGFVGIYALIRKAAEKARKRGFQPVTEFGAPFFEPGEPSRADPGLTAPHGANRLDGRPR